ncbi:hypothetical protein LINPERHAP1_LOCUS13847 [Linum perenne]
MAPPRLIGLVPKLFPTILNLITGLAVGLILSFSLWGFMFRFSACVMRESISSLGKVLILKEAIFPLERNAVPLALTVISGGAGLSFASLNALSLLQLQNRGGRSIEGFAINH